MHESVGNRPKVSILRALHAAAREQRSGILVLSNGDEEIRLLLSAGRIVCATASGAARIGDAMVEQGLLSDSLLEDVLRVQKRKKVKQPLGTIIAELGLVEKDEAELMLRDQAVNLLQQAISWEGGEACYESMATGFEGVAPTSSWSVEDLLARALRAAG